MSQIEGLDELFAQLDGELLEAVLDGAAVGLKDGLELTVAAAKQRAPEITGDLRNSIASVVERKPDSVDGQVIAMSDHAVYVEFGTGDRGQASHEGTAPIDLTYTLGGWTYKDPKTDEFRFTLGQPAQPYLYPAVQETEEKVLESVRRGVEKRLGEVFGGGVG